MSKEVYQRSVSLLLSAMYQRGEAGFKQSFMFGRPGAAHWQKPFGVELHYRRKEMLRATLYIRQNGPVYLRNLSVSNVWQLLAEFVSENYWFLMEEAFFEKFEHSYAEQVSRKTQELIAIALESSRIFNPSKNLSLYPLVTIKIKNDFISPEFFIVKPESFTGSLIPKGIPPNEILSNQFPPVNFKHGRKDNPEGWLGVYSPSVATSNKIKAAILGAVALIPETNHRHMFSGRSMFGGVCTLADTTSVSFGDIHTPPLMYDITITEGDHKWLQILSNKIEDVDPNARKQVRALEYFYRAWPLDENERFAWLFMTLDAIFGTREKGMATKSFVDGVLQNIQAGQFDEKRLRKLLNLRGVVIHGGAPDVYDCEEYQEYYIEYESNPIRDLENISAECLRKFIFIDSFYKHEALPVAD